MIVLTGLFQEFFIFATLLFVHELGHFLTGYFCGFELDKIYFYPYGGCSKFKTKINVPLWKEFLVLIMGPIMQIICYIVLSFILTRPGDIMLLQSYHYGILVFNLLPIYPLDGGKFLSILLASWIPYKKSLNLTFLLSSIFLGIYFCLSFFISPIFEGCLMSLLLFSKLREEYKKKYLYYNKFLLERYLEPISFTKRKIIAREEDMYRDHKHLLFYNHRYYSEHEFLENHFQKRGK